MVPSCVSGRGKAGCFTLRSLCACECFVNTALYGEEGACVCEMYVCLVCEGSWVSVKGGGS